MRFNIAINGYGRIGRCVFRALYESPFRKLFKIVAINEIAELNAMLHLTRYDSIHGRFPYPISILPNNMIEVEGDRISVFHYKDIHQIPWADFDVDIVMECTGTCGSRQIAEQHLKQGAKKVLISHPADTHVDATIVFGVNHHLLTSQSTIISNASCTSNCIVPIVKVMDDAFGVERGLSTTIHSMMNDQPVIDTYHHPDLRRARAAGCAVVPVKTELAHGIGRILPHLAGAFESLAVRVPTMNVSAMDISLQLSTNTNGVAVNRVLGDAAAGRMKGVIGYSEDPLISIDYNHDPRSSIIDGTQTRVARDKMVKIFCFFDNEWGYAHRMLDTASIWMRTLT